jgi:hypothetical protein
MAKAGRPRLDPTGAPSKFLPVRTTEAEQKVYKEAADEAGVSLSEWIRDRLGKAAKRESKKPKRKRVGT